MSSSSSNAEGTMTLSQQAHRDRVPISLRTMFYVTLFLATMFGGGAWLFYQVDVYFPKIHVELGAWRSVGVILFLTALFSFLGCTWVLMRNGKGANAEFDPPSQLVQVGPYRWVRNPVTLCVAFMLLGEALALSSTGMLLGMFFAAVMAKLQSIMEERLLPQRFGDEYLQYRERVPRWIPRRPTEASLPIETPHGT